MSTSATSNSLPHAASSASHDASPTSAPPPSPGGGPAALPWGALLVLATAVFLTSLTETLPAGLLPAMSAGLGVGEAAAGQTVTVYAAGTALTALPLAAATAGWRRKRLLLVAVTGFALANAVTALSTSYGVTMGARAVAGVAAGLAWSLLAGYARRLVAPAQRGRAVTVVMAGVPLALSLGVPAGTFLGKALGWRAAFAVMALLAFLLLAAIAVLVPERDGGRGTARVPVRRALAVPGVLPVLFVTLALVLAHTVLYTYVAAFLHRLGLGGAEGFALLVFGGASLTGVWAVGLFVDRGARRMTVAATALLAAGVTGLAAAGAGGTAAVYAAMALWGLGWGGAPALLQTAVADAGKEAADTAQTVLVTLWNAAMAGGGVAGGLLLDRVGVAALPWTALFLLLPALAVVLAARRHGFPATKATKTAKTAPAT